MAVVAMYGSKTGGPKDGDAEHAASDAGFRSNSLIIFNFLDLGSGYGEVANHRIKVHQL
ncbi:MAG: hypothetical protein V9G98_07695 [Candidatus Competibacter sp.]|jgi:hypothetical protein